MFQNYSPQTQQPRFGGQPQSLGPQAFGKQPQQAYKPQQAIIKPPQAYQQNPQALANRSYQHPQQAYPNQAPIIASPQQYRTPYVQPQFNQYSSGPPQQPQQRFQSPQSQSKHQEYSSPIQARYPQPLVKQYAPPQFHVQPTTEEPDSSMMVALIKENQELKQKIQQKENELKTINEQLEQLKNGGYNEMAYETQKFDEFE